MTKQESTIIKGIAILLMLFLHLFNHTDGLCHYLINIGNAPLSLYLSRAANPVAFYILLGGYGQYYIYINGDNRRLSRIYNLYITFWIITTLAAVIYFCCGLNYFKNDIHLAFRIYLGISPHINHPAWFLLPYVLLSISSKFLFKYFDRFKAWHVIISMLLMKIATSYIISKGQNVLPKYEYVYIVILYLHLLPSFIIGATLHRLNLLDYIRRSIPNKIAFPLLILLIALRCTFTTSIFDTIYTIVFMGLFLSIHRPQFIDYTLQLLGEHSTNIWLIHAYIYGELLHNYIYGLSFVPLIYLGLIITSLMASYVINYIKRPFLIR